MSGKITDRIDPFTAKATIKGKKQKRSQGSSHYRPNTAPELQALPHLKGELINLMLERRQDSGLYLQCQTLKM